MMRHLAGVAVMTALLAGWGDAAGQQQRANDDGPFGPAATRGTASIAGHVRAPAANAPVRGAEVVATHRAGARVTTTTDENGAYRLDRLAAGEWQVTASKTGFVSWQYGQRRPFHTPPPISLAAGQRFDADIPLTRGGAISGRIYDAAGDPAAGVQVRAYRATMEQGSRRLKNVGPSDLTDDTGAFRIYGLPPGHYYVGASLRVAPLDSVVETTYMPTYFPGTGDLADAQRITLDLGGEAGATFPLLRIRPTRISGLVLTAAGRPADAFLNLSSQAAELGASLGTGGVTRSDGTFTMPDIAPGRYWLKASLRGDGPDESVTIAVTVDGNELSGITLVTGPPATLRGSVVIESGARTLPRPPTIVAVSARQPGTVLNSADGPAFEIGNLGEPFQVVVEDLPETWAVKQITMSGTDVTDTPIELPPGQAGEARIVVTDRLTEITGTAPPVGGAGPVIVVFPQNATKWTPRSRYVRRVEADARGRFRIVGLPAGEQYLAYAADYVEAGEHLDPEFLNAITSASVPFVLAEAERLTLELKVVER